MKKINKIMIIGGCFDMLHPGHLDFLAKAKKLCDHLVVLLEPDEKIRLMKGKDRPVQNLESRILNLGKTGLVDKVIALPVLRTDEEYEKILTNTIKYYPILTNTNQNKKQGNTEAQKNIRNAESNICVDPLVIRVDPLFVFGITKNDRNKIKNEKIRALGKKLGIEVIEVNILLPEWSTTKLVASS